MKVTADTNILVRAVVCDHKEQSETAAKILQTARLVAIPTPVLCEFVWVLRRGYRRSVTEISQAIRHLLDCPSVVMNETVIRAGLDMLESGGDFADGVISCEGSLMGGDKFISFDREAVAFLISQGKQAQLLE